MNESGALPVTLPPYLTRISLALAITQPKDPVMSNELPYVAIIFIFSKLRTITRLLQLANFKLLSSFVSIVSKGKDV